RRFVRRVSATHAFSVMSRGCTAAAQSTFRTGVRVNDSAYLCEGWRRNGGERVAAATPNVDVLGSNRPLQGTPVPGTWGHPAVEPSSRKRRGPWPRACDGRTLVGSMRSKPATHLLLDRARARMRRKALLPFVAFDP